MIKIQIPLRLRVIAKFVPKGMVVADIGSDHAFLPVYLIKTGVCTQVVASDCNEGPVESSKRTVSNYGLENKIDIRWGNGLAVLEPGEADVVILSGMGGKLIIKILEQSPTVLKYLQRLILQPNSGDELLRFWLVENGWGIIDEQLVEEHNKLYPVIVAEKGKGFLAKDPYLLEVGPCISQNSGSLLVKLLKKKDWKYEKRLNELIGGSGVEIKRKINQAVYLRRKIKEALFNAYKG